MILWDIVSVFFLSSNASSKHFVPEWFWGKSATSWTLQSGGLENSGPKISTTRIPETHHCGGARPDQPWDLFASCRGARRRAPNSCSTTNESSTHTGQAFALWCSGGNQVVAWGNPEGGGDWRRSWRCTLECPGNSGHRQSICRNLNWWVSDFLGQSRRWWWLLRSSRSAHERPANSGHRRCICSDIGWWIRGCLGQSRPWWWLLRSSGSAQKRAAYSGNIHCNLLWFWTMDQWRLGATKSLVVIAPKFKISSAMCTKFRQMASHLRQS